MLPAGAAAADGAARGGRRLQQPGFTTTGFAPLAAPAPAPEQAPAVAASPSPAVGPSPGPRGPATTTPTALQPAPAPSPEAVTPVPAAPLVGPPTPGKPLWRPLLLESAMPVLCTATQVQLGRATAHPAARPPTIVLPCLQCCRRHRSACSRPPPPAAPQWHLLPPQASDSALQVHYVAMMLHANLHPCTKAPHQGWPATP